MATDFLGKVKGQVGGPELVWRNYAQGSFHYFTAASGVTTATISNTKGVVKGIFLTAGLNAAATLTLGGADTQRWGSAGLTAGFSPAWWGCNNAYLQTATAQIVGILFGTGLPPFEY